MTLAPDLAAPIAGWRIWTVADAGRGPELVSPLRRMAWSHRVPTTASCVAGCDPCPSSGCRCGLYATAGLGVLPFGAGVVLGCTALWGRVVEHTGGWRGEHGYPLVLFVSSSPYRLPAPVRRLRRLQATASDGDRLGLEDDFGGVDALARELSRLYAVPVHHLSSGLVGRGGDPAAGRAADALRSEAAGGLALRRSADPAAHDRLARCVQDLLDSVGD